MKLVLIFLKVFLSLLLGCCALGFFIHKDPWSRDFLSFHIARLMTRNSGSVMQCRVTSFNLVRCQITIEDIEVAPVVPDDCSWRWSCKKHILRSSWWRLFKRGVLEIVSSVQDIKVYTAVSGKTPAIRPHLQSFLDSPISIPYRIKQMRIDHFDLVLKDASVGITCSVAGKSRSRLSGAKTKTIATITSCALDGCALEQYGHIGGGTLEADVALRKSGIDIQLQGAFEAELAFLPLQERVVKLQGSWKDGGGYLEIYNDLYNLVAHATQLSDGFPVRVTGYFPLSYIDSLLRGDSKSPVVGLCSVTAACDFFRSGSESCAHIVLDRPGYEKITCKGVKADLTFSSHEVSAQGVVEISAQDRCEIKGLYTFADAHAQLGFEASIAARTHNKPMHAAGFLSREKEEVRGNFTLAHEQKAPFCRAELQGDLSTFGVQGTLHETSFTARGSCTGPILVENVVAVDSTGKECLSLSGVQDGIKGVLDFSVIKGAAHHVFGIDLHGEGTLQLDAQKQQDELKTAFSFSGGAFRIPSMYNGITSCMAKGSWSMRNRIMQLSSLDVGFHQGTLSVQDGSMSFDDGYQLKKCKIPLHVKECFVSYNKDFFAVVSGNGHLQKDEGIHEVVFEGSLDRAHMKGAPLANKPGTLHNHDYFLEHFIGAGNSLFLDVSLHTKEPVKVKIPFVQTRAAAHISLRGYVPHVDIGGQVSLEGGLLLFPYKPLYITSGTIMLMPGQPSDPVIELTAKSSIKKYTVSMIASGSVSKPKLSFSSVPHLQEEQIIALLYTGSEDAGLLSAVPSVIMQNVQQLVFGSADDITSAAKYIKKMLRPFGSIRVVPTIGDNKDHTGLQARVEVDINDRIRASVHKNLGAAEDARLELEYALSDEVSVRGCKDERGDMTAEVEFRLRL